MTRLLAPFRRALSRWQDRRYKATHCVCGWCVECLGEGPY